MVNRKTAAKTVQIGYWVTRSGYVGKDRELSHLSLNTAAVNEPLVGPVMTGIVLQVAEFGGGWRSTAAGELSNQQLTGAASAV